MVQVYGVDINPMPRGSFYTAFLILSDGSHATATCFEAPGTSPCEIEAFAAEKRVKVPCDSAKIKGVFTTCYQSERYEGDRKNNDITLRTGNGKVTYHITGSW